MNGHSSAETLAFRIMAAARRFEGLVGDPDDAPIFIFGAGPCSGVDELGARLSRTTATELLLDQSVISALAHQFARVATANLASLVGNQVDDQARASSIAKSQASFLRAVAAAGEQTQIPKRWGLVSTALTGDYALYFKLLFPRAKIVFLHRNPLEAFDAFLQGCHVEFSRADGSASEVAERFAENWCALVASFELWHKDVGGILVSYERAVLSDPRELETYLAEQMSPATTSRPATSAGSTTPQEGTVRPTYDLQQVIFERVAETAGRCGYRLGGGNGAACEVPTAAAPMCHTRRVADTRASCAVLVPAARYIEPECDEALRELERRGYAVKRMHGASPVDHARSRLATEAIDEGFEETLWIDADMRFDPSDVERLRSRDLPIVAGLYSRRFPRGGLAMAPIPGTREVLLGEGGGLVEVLYVGAGFLLVRREVYSVIQERFRLPRCDEGRSRPTIPFFMPMLEDWGGKLKYLSEDYAFCRRARLSGYKIIADTSVQLWHMGIYAYGHEDAANKIQQAAACRHVFLPNKERG